MNVNRLVDTEDKSPPPLQCLRNKRYLFGIQMFEESPALKKDENLPAYGCGKGGEPCSINVGCRKISGNLRENFFRKAFFPFPEALLTSLTQQFFDRAILNSKPKAARKPNEPSSRGLFKPPKDERWKYVAFFAVPWLKTEPADFIN